MSEVVKQNVQTSEKKEDDEINVSTTESLTGSELATLDFLEHALIQEEELDCSAPNLDGPADEVKARITTFPVSVKDAFSTSNHTLSTYTNKNEETRILKLSANVNLVSQQEFTSSSTDTKTPGAANDQKSRNFCVAEKEPNSVPIDHTSALINSRSDYNGITSYNPEMVHPMFIPQAPPLPGPVKIPRPDYDDPPNVIGSANGLATNGLTASDSTDTSTSFNVAAMETNYLKSAKQVAYVKPHMKGPEEGGELHNGSITQMSPERKKYLGYSKSPKGVNAQGQRPVSLAVSSNLSQCNNNLIQEVEMTQYNQLVKVFALQIFVECGSS